jgi:hypothetical protein
MPPLRGLECTQKRTGRGLRGAVPGRDAAMTHDQRPSVYFRACAAPNGMRRRPREVILAPHAGVHGGAAPRAEWRGWPRPRVRGQPRAGVKMPWAMVESAEGGGLRLPNVWQLANLRGAAPHAPRWGTLTVPQTPPQPPWSPASGGLGADSTHVRNEVDRFLMRTVPPLSLWERGLGGEGKRCFAMPQTI